MFNSPVLDLVILLSFTYFIGSILISAVNEAIAGTLSLRQKNLKTAIESLDLSPTWATYVQTTLINSPHLEALMKSKNAYPSYIDASHFVLAIIHELGSASYMANISTAITNSAIPAGFKSVLLDIAIKCQNNATAFEAELTTFFNNSMERAGGWYTRRIRSILIVIAIVLSTILNIDTIKITKDALADKQRLSKTVDQIAANLPHITATDSSVTISDSTGKNPLRQNTRTNSTSASVSVKAVTDKIKNISVIYQQDTGLKLGYETFDDFKDDWSKNPFLKFLGILITAFALQLGANYWFNILSKAVNIRAAGKKPKAS